MKLFDVGVRRSWRPAARSATRPVGRRSSCARCGGACRRASKQPRPVDPVLGVDRPESDQIGKDRHRAPTGRSAVYCAGSASGRSDTRASANSSGMNGSSPADSSGGHPFRIVASDRSPIETRQEFAQDDRLIVPAELSGRAVRRPAPRARPRRARGRRTRCARGANARCICDMNTCESLRGSPMIAVPSVLRSTSRPSAPSSSLAGSSR